MAPAIAPGRPLRRELRPPPPTPSPSVLFSRRVALQFLSPAPGAEIIPSKRPDRRAVFAFAQSRGCSLAMPRNDRSVASKHDGGGGSRPPEWGGRLTVTGRWASPSSAGFVDHQNGRGLGAGVRSRRPLPRPFSWHRVPQSRVGLAVAWACSERSADLELEDVSVAWTGVAIAPRSPTPL